MITRTTHKLGYQTYTAQRETGYKKEELRRFYVEWREFEQWFYEDQHDNLEERCLHARKLWKGM